MLFHYLLQPTENISRERPFKTKSFIKYKMPMPHMFSVVAKDTSSGEILEMYDILFK